jgi:phospholipid N-methyltransferase
VERLEFLGAFLKRPGMVGALFPSSPQLARAMLQDCDLRHAKTVVELGPGTGSFTRLILERLGPQTLFFALELDPDAVTRLRQRLPQLTLHHDSAEHFREHLARYNRAEADCVISGLPWANMRPDRQDRILNAVVGGLAPHGVFATFAYLHACWLPVAVRFRQQLRSRFDSVQLSRVVWRNLPPAFVYRCRHRRLAPTAAG